MVRPFKESMDPIYSIKWYVLDVVGGAFQSLTLRLGLFGGGQITDEPVQPASRRRG
jgi:hypothetical protein